MNRVFYFAKSMQPIKTKSKFHNSLNKIQDDPPIPDMKMSNSNSENTTVYKF